MDAIDLADARLSQIAERANAEPRVNSGLRYIRPTEPTDVPAFTLYLLETARLQRTLTDVMEQMQLHKAVCAEITKRGASPEKVEGYTEDVARWRERLEHLLD